ncbi:unnamed protein product, partial [Staurois parvus]
MPPGTFFIGFFEFGQGHRGPMIPYCPGAPMTCQSAPGHVCHFFNFVQSFTLQTKSLCY